MCRAHELLAQDAAKQMQERGGFLHTAASIVDDVLSGRGLQQEKVARAINEGIWEMGGGYSRFSPDLEDVDFTPSTGGVPPNTGRRASSQPRYRPGWAREEAPPPPPPSEQAEAARKVALARQILGFGPGEPITADVLRARHRELAKKHHPDRGGSVTRMQEINAAADVIAASLP